MGFNPAVTCYLESDQSEISLLLSGQLQAHICQSGERFSDETIVGSVKCTQKPGVEVTGQPHRQLSNCSGKKNRQESSRISFSFILEVNVHFGREDEF